MEAGCSSPNQKKYKQAFATNGKTIVATVFWHYKGVSLMEFLEGNTTINSTALHPS